MMSSTPGRSGSRYIREVEIPSSKSSLRARSNKPSRRVRLRTARFEAIPKFSLYRRPSGSRIVSAADSYVPASHEPNMTLPAPAASAKATSLGYRTPPSAHTEPPIRRASSEHSRTAENCGRPTPVIMRVVHIAPGPTPTLTMLAPALMRSRVPPAVTTLPATMIASGAALRACSTAVIMRV